MVAGRDSRMPLGVPGPTPAWRKRSCRLWKEVGVGPCVSGDPQARSTRVGSLAPAEGAVAFTSCTGTADPRLLVHLGGVAGWCWNSTKV